MKQHEAVAWPDHIRHVQCPGRRVWATGKRDIILDTAGGKKDVPYRDSARRLTVVRRL